MNVRLYPVEGGLALESPYHPDLVAGIKGLPFNDRRWDQARRAWIIAPSRAGDVAQIVFEHLGVQLVVPAASQQPAAPQIRVVRLEYLGRCKQRGDESSASGYADGGWNVLFPEAVLRAWFAAEEPNDAEPEQPKTLYQVLGLRQTADGDAVKKAYRQLARQWHPDVCREPDAREQFERIQKAYEVLRDDKTRKRYDAGLKLEASYQQHAEQEHRVKNMLRRRHDEDVYGYRAPLRCGLLLVEGVARVGQLVVSKILMWDDIIDARGRTMVSSWPAGAQTFEVRWA